VAELAKLREAITAQGTQLAFVHMGSTEQGREFLAHYGFADVHHFSDPNCVIYRAFGLARAPFWAFINLGLWRRAIESMRKGHGVAFTRSDMKRMPGVFLLHQGAIVRAYRHATVADRPDYTTLACPLSSSH
jgi:hypothetical protein